MGSDPGPAREAGFDHQFPAEFGDALAHRRDADAGPPAFRQACPIVAYLHVQAVIEPDPRQAPGGVREYEIIAVRYI